MKILKFTAENIKKLKVVSITPTGAIVEITGPNGSGKTSVLDAIFYCLAGTKEIPAQPIRRGQLKAHVTLELGEITVTRKFSKDTGTSLVVEAKNGARFSSPQKMLDELLGKLTFDPLAFSRMDPKKQLEQLRSMVKVDVDLDELDRLNAADFDNRTELNRAIKSLDAQGNAITYPENTPDEPIDISKLADELEEAGKANASRDRERADLNRVVVMILSVKDRVSQLAERAAALHIEATKLEKQATDEQAKLDDLETTSSALSASLAKDSIQVETAALREQIGAAQIVNGYVAKKKQQYEIFGRAKTSRAAADALTEAMAGRTNAKQAAIASANMPIDGLSFGDGEVIYNGLPFGQSSSAEQLRVSVAVAMAANPKLRVLRIQDGSLLDEGGMKMLAAMAEAADYQVWIERVDTSGKVGVVMEEGEVKAK